MVGCSALCGAFFFFNDTATTEIYTLSLHDALPILDDLELFCDQIGDFLRLVADALDRSEEHTSELQSLRQLVCRLLLEKKKQFPMQRLGRLPGLMGGRTRSAASWD